MLPETNKTLFKKFSKVAEFRRILFKLIVFMCVYYTLYFDTLTDKFEPQLNSPFINGPKYPISCV